MSLVRDDERFNQVLVQAVFFPKSLFFPFYVLAVRSHICGVTDWEVGEPVVPSLNVLLPIQNVSHGARPTRSDSARSVLLEMEVRKRNLLQ